MGHHLVRSLFFSKNGQFWQKSWAPQNFLIGAKSQFQFSGKHFHFNNHGTRNFRWKTQNLLVKITTVMARNTSSKSNELYNSISGMITPSQKPWKTYKIHWFLGLFSSKFHGSKSKFFGWKIPEIRISWRKPVRGAQAMRQAGHADHPRTAPTAAQER